MSQFEKLLEKFLLSPCSLGFRDVEKILFTLGFEKRDCKGSHVQYRSIKHRIILTFALHNNDCKDIYKKQTAKILQSILNK